MSFDKTVMIECRLSDIADIHNSKRVPLNSREREKKKGIYPYYGASGIVDYIDNYLFEGEYVLISEDGENLRSRNTPIAFKADGKFWVNNHAHIVKGKKELLNDFIVYYFSNLNINAFVTGAVQPKLNKENLLNIPIWIPKREDTLKRLTLILKSLDDKIELNRQTNQTLEAMAQALFKEMCLPKGDELPVGWKVGKLGDVMTLQRGYDLPTTTRTHGRYPVIAASGVNGFHNESKNSAPGVTTGRSGVIGNVFYIQEDFWALNTSLFVKEFKIGDPIFSFFVLKLIDLASHNGGSAVPTLNRNHVHEVDVIIPTLDVIQKFSSQSIPLYQQIKNNEQENQTLTSLRDGLLPKLMKGEIQLT